MDDLILIQTSTSRRRIRMKLSKYPLARAFEIHIVVNIEGQLSLVAKLSPCNRTKQCR